MFHYKKKSINPLFEFIIFEFMICCYAFVYFKDVLQITFNQNILQSAETAETDILSAQLTKIKVEFQNGKLLSWWK